MITEYMCDCGCCQPILMELCVVKAERLRWPSRCGSRYDSRDIFSHCKKHGGRNAVRARIDTNCKSNGRDMASRKPFWTG